MGDYPEKSVNRLQERFRELFCTYSNHFKPNPYLVLGAKVRSECPRLIVKNIKENVQLNRCDIIDFLWH